MKKPKLHIFDLETSHANFWLANEFSKNFSENSVAEFLNASLSSSVQNHPLFQLHNNSQIVQLYSTGMFKKGDRGWNRVNLDDYKSSGNKFSKFIESDFAKQKGFLKKANRKRKIVMNEEQRLHAFYDALDHSINTHGSAVLAGHNIGSFDLWGLENATYRYNSLKHRRAYFAKQAQAGKLEIVDTLYELRKKAVGFKGKSSVAETKFIKGLNIEDLSPHVGVNLAGNAHDAYDDVRGTKGVYNYVRSGKSVPELVEKVQAAAQAKKATGGGSIPPPPPPSFTGTGSIPPPPPPHDLFGVSSAPFRRKMFAWSKNFEEWTPNRLGTTFGLSERASSYLATTIQYERSSLVKDGNLTKLGEHFQRVVGDHLNIYETPEQGLVFRRIKANSPLLHLEGHKSLAVRFSTTGKRMSSAAAGLNAPLYKNPWSFDTNKSTWSNFTSWRHKQHVPNFHHGATSSGEFIHEFTPWYASVEGQKAKNFWRALEPQLYEAALRPQKLLSEFGLGLKAGSYNKAFHIPFVGEGGLINGLLTKRVLPVAIGIAGLGYADYLLGHKPSNTAINLGLRANVLRADLTDQIPGARKITDTYANTVPGPQYGPLALPFGGIFAGGVLHMTDVWRGKYKGGDAIAKGLRDAEAAVLPKLSNIKRAFQADAGVGKTAEYLWHSFGKPGKGGLVGLALMIPFIPGMLGSRKTGTQLRRIYSGEEEVPIRQGRWWEVGENKFEGSRITSWRPHASILWKSRAKAKSLYGSEENYWSHNPILHPLRYLKDPYYLEKLHYKDRPYPVTSPAFSNLPLIGSFAAATLGKWVKPVVRMHADEWKDDDYTLYSNRLEPRGPQVDSKFEAQVRHELNKKGYDVKTQHKIGDYRVDFAIEDEGKKIAIEADGYTWHHTTRKLSQDLVRQKYLEEKGWNVIRIQSRPFFRDPSSAMEPIYKTLSELGVQPKDIGNKDPYSGLLGLRPVKAKEEFGFWDSIKKETRTAAEFVGLLGFTAKSVFNKLNPFDDHKEVYLQGSRQMDSWSRQYYERNAGAGMMWSPETDNGLVGYTEALRRFVQHEGFSPQVNEIKNTMPDWLPGDDYMINFQKGDPYIRLDDGYARLPGAGYEALHPELAGVDPANYPDIHKLRILGDVAPYSRQFQSLKMHMDKQSQGNPELRADYEKIVEQVRQTKESTLDVDKRRFTAPVDVVEGTVKSVSSAGITLAEMPGRTFQFSGVGSTMADLVADMLGKQNSLTKADAAHIADHKLKERDQWLSDALASGTKVKLTVPRGAADSATRVQAVIEASGQNINRKLIDLGYGRLRKDLAGAEYQAMFEGASKNLGILGEEASFTGDTGAFNPLRFIPTPAHTKLWQERTAYSQYKAQEVVGTRMRRWEKPIHDFIAPYLRGGMERITGVVKPSSEHQRNRDLNTLTDILGYLRGINGLAKDSGDRALHTSQVSRSAIGSNLLGSSSYVGSTLPDREARYFRRFLDETDPDVRSQILSIVPDETRKALQAQWALQKQQIAAAEGKDASLPASQGRLYSKEELQEYKRAKTELGIGDWIRSKEIASFFSRTGYKLPETDSPVLSDVLDYQDVKLKIVQQEGYDAHDFNLFDDRSSLLWRKPYIDGAVRELTSGETRSDEQIRKTVEAMMMAAGQKNPDVRSQSTTSKKSNARVRVDVSLDDETNLYKDLHRNPEEYKS